MRFVGIEGLGEDDKGGGMKFAFRFVCLFVQLTWRISDA